MIHAQILTLHHRNDRQENIIKELSNQNNDEISWNFNYGFKDHRKTSLNIARGHKMIVQMAKEHDLKEVLILEDDCIFTSPESLNYFFENKPTEFDIYLGGIYYGEIDENNRVKKFSGLHCYIVSQRYYDTFLRLSIAAGNIDTTISNTGGEFVVCNPFIAKQLNDYSDHVKKVVDYEHLLTGRKFL